MESLKIFDNFKFSDLNEDWIQSIWDKEFMIYNEPPDEYLMFLESEDMRLLLHESCMVVKDWLEEGTNQNDFENCSEISWNTLIIMDIKVRALLAILGYIIKTGQSKEADVDSRQSCLYATSLYFVLLAIPGSSAFNVFHPNLYQHAIETLKISSEQLQPPIKKRNKTMNLDDLSMMEESVNESITLSSNEKEILIQNLNIIICNLIMMIKSFWFKDHVQSLDITIYGLLEVTKIEDDCMASYYCNKQVSTLEASLPQNAYAALQELCDNKHGPVKVTITFIVKYILPRLLYGPMDTQAKFITNIREHTINFLKDLLYAYEKEAKTAILTLVQHLMLKCPDRLEARQKQASVLVKLLRICKQNIALEAFKDLMLLSHHSKIPFRLFAQEVIGKLFESFFMNCNIADSLKIRIKRVLFAIALSRCMDCSSMVRGKAMAIIADFTDSNNEIDKAIFQTIFEKSDPTKKFPTFLDMKDALSEDIDLLPGLNALITMLTERIEDERAMVRKSTLLILKNLTITFPSLIHKVLPIINHRCRDPTLIVRRFAVQVLSQLVQQFPDNSLLLDEWVEAVVPQIFDIEIKVQEKVLEYLQELLLNKIKNVSMSADNTASDLPWKILNTITNLKMRKHLSKACSLWIRSGIITNTVIKNIQSHIGTNNNIEAWVFLVALAENTNLPNMDKYFLNYKEIVAENNFCTSLVLQVLRYSWKSLDLEILEHLHIYLYKRLQQFEINFGLISICLDIIHNIIHYLSPDKNNLLESNMVNLIKISEIEIAKIFKSENEALEAAPNYLKAMFTMGYATLLCTYKISPLTLRILQGFLLEWEALPEVIKEIEQLQASAVVILGQQAMRDRDVAKEVVPIFGRLMRQETNLNSIAQIAVKINVAKALADICIRFTALVEPYLSDMCVSMKDSSPQVREAIVVIFIQLLLEDYIKMKGPFFFHILTMLSDSDDMIRELTIFLIEERLLTKNKTLISQQFLQSIYHYNNYQSQHKICHHRMRENEKKTLTLPGKINENKRRAIYNFMLDHLDPPGKIKLLVKVTSQILGGTYVDAIDVKKEEGAYVLRDALYIISNYRLRPSSFNRHVDDDQQEYEESTVQTISPASNAITIIIEGIKKHGLEVLLPVLIKLRIKLSGLKSPVENDVKQILVKTYSEYNKDQLLNILNEYPKLEKEIEQFRKQLEETRLDNENFTDEETSPSGSNNQNTSIKTLDISSPILQPTVSLQHILISQLSNCRSTAANSVSPTSFLDGWSSPICSTPILDPQPGPSTSTPYPYCDFDSNSTVGHTKRARRLPTFFPNEKELSSFHYNTRRKHIFQVQDDSESD
ncbi:Condensin-2 complex subunit D3 [Habropoda laboriosa]|uniref:Condensin-2 complex subunit D3 n=1 Tax=Habropoda laboriosa TaxID=597456 RepID=A0A0L7RJ37_9HYME|nr:PREDICTED: condensin-2 complex subunit D3-like [Habropoda laboriosa]KOC70860.1 Condensin-2 complex subunit D3 [Habropoda laboriosa]